MAVKLDEVRKVALALPDTTEEPHHNFGSFRVRGKIFVTIPPGGELLHIFLPAEQRELALAMDPDFLEPVHWGSKILGVRAKAAARAQGHGAEPGAPGLRVQVRAGVCRWPAFESALVQEKRGLTLRGNDMRYATLALLVATPLALAACVSPKVVHYYDQDCQIMARRVELDITHAQAVENCSNQECVAQALGGVVAFAASAVVSGSIAVVGNAVYWLERTSNCKVKSPQQG